MSSYDDLALDKLAKVVEGYERRRHKNDYTKFPNYTLASCDETKAI